MDEVSDLMKGVKGEAYVERLVGDVDVERLDGTTEQNLAMYRKEKLLDGDDIESVYEREYVAIKEGEVPYEIYLGNDKGDNITIKERKVK